MARIDRVRIAGLLYLTTFVTSIPALLLKRDLLARPTDASGVGAARAGALLEVLLAAACVGTAVALYPALRRHGPARALGFVAARVVEAGLVMTGVVCVLALAGGLEEPAAGAVVALHDAAFLIGPGLVPAVNAALLGSVLWQFRLVPRVLPAIGLAGALLLTASVVGTVLGRVDQVSALAGLLALPIALWEFGLGCWLLGRGLASPGSD